MSALSLRRRPRRYTAADLPNPRRLTGPLPIVRARLSEIEQIAGDAGLLAEQIDQGTMPNGHVRVDVHFVRAPAPPRWWVGRSWKFWTPVASGALAVFGASLWALVLIMQAFFAALTQIATAALGGLVILGAVALFASVRSGGTWKGSGTWS